jgi:hypothetical protein
MPTSADILSYSTLTPAVNEMKAPNSMLKNYLFGRDVTVPTRQIELSFLRRGRKIAPFVQRNGAAIMTEGRNEEFRIVQPAHIRVKRPMNPSELLNKRRPGSVIHIEAGGIQAAMRQYMADELGMLMDDVTNSEEYLCALALRGQISYQAADESAFTVTFPRSASHDVVLTGGDLWSAASTAKPAQDFMDAGTLVNDDVSLNVTDVLLGADAADAFLACDEVQEKLNVNTGVALKTGTIDLNNQYQESGAMLLGVYVHGIKVWRYARQVEVAGSAVSLIRPDYAEFVARTPAAQMVTYYGAIEDMKAIGAGQVLQSKRFSKSWEEEDPSARMLLVESNPLPCMRRPDATVSMKVV